MVFVPGPGVGAIVAASEDMLRYSRVLAGEADLLPSVAAVTVGYTGLTPEEAPSVKPITDALNQAPEALEKLRNALHEMLLESAQAFADVARILADADEAASADLAPLMENVQRTATAAGPVPDAGGVGSTSEGRSTKTNL